MKLTITQELLKAYQAVAKQERFALPALSDKTWNLTQESQCLSSPEDAMNSIINFNPVAGWLGFQSINQIVRPGESLPIQTKSTGILLNAELTGATGAGTKDTGSSISLHYNNAGGWIVTTYKYAAEGDYLLDLVKLAIHGEPGGFLHYNRFWCLDSTTQLGTVPFAACLFNVQPK